MESALCGSRLLDRPPLVIEVAVFVLAAHQHGSDAVPRPATRRCRDVAEAEPDAAVAARLQSGVLAQIKTCTGKWCQVSGKDFTGWIAQERLWGAYPNEKIE